MQLMIIVVLEKVKKERKVGVAAHGTPSHSYGVSLAIWDHTVLPATRHKWTHPAFTPASQAGAGGVVVTAVTGIQCAQVVAVVVVVENKNKNEILRRQIAMTAD